MNVSFVIERPYVLLRLRKRRNVPACTLFVRYGGVNGVQLPDAGVVLAKLSPVALGLTDTHKVSVLGGGRQPFGRLVAKRDGLQRKLMRGLVVTRTLTMLKDHRRVIVICSGFDVSGGAKLRHAPSPPLIARSNDRPIDVVIGSISLVLPKHCRQFGIVWRSRRSPSRRDRGPTRPRHPEGGHRSEPFVFPHRKRMKSEHPRNKRATSAASSSVPTAQIAVTPHAERRYAVFLSPQSKTRQG